MKMWGWCNSRRVSDEKMFRAFQAKAGVYGHRRGCVQPGWGENVPGNAQNAWNLSPEGAWLPKTNLNLILMTSMHNLIFYCRSIHTISKPGLRLWVEFKLYWVKTERFLNAWIRNNCWAFSSIILLFFPFPDMKMVFKKVRKEMEEASREQWTLRAWYLFIYGFNPSVGKTSEHLKIVFISFLQFPIAHFPNKRKSFLQGRQLLCRVSFESCKLLDCHPFGFFLIVFWFHSMADSGVVFLVFFFPYLSSCGVFGGALGGGWVLGEPCHG